MSWFPNLLNLYSLLYFILFPSIYISKFVILVKLSPKTFILFKSSISYLQLISAFISKFSSSGIDLFLSSDCDFKANLIIKIITIIIIIKTDIPPIININFFFGFLSFLLIGIDS